MRFVGPGTLRNQLSDDAGIDVVSTKPVHVAINVFEPEKEPFFVHDFELSRTKDPG
jgi:hypothetical protein